MIDSQPYRHLDGGAIDRGKPLKFKFDGNPYNGFQGDTLASALLANGVRLVGRSFKYHRRRGIFGLGVEEPSALIQLRSGNRSEPNIRATEIELFDGLQAYSQNRWPSLAWDIGSTANLMSPLLPAGFYYKTFMWPASAWMHYERYIRRAAGLGKSATVPDPDTYSKLYQFCEVLVVGAGPAGISAALSASKSGARIILMDETASPGGRLCFDNQQIDNAAASKWIDSSLKQLRNMPNVEVLTRTTAVGFYDDNMLVALERIADHRLVPERHEDRQRVRWIRANQVVLATGAIERSIAFHNNDKPGVMLASAVRGYANRYAVKAGRQAIVFTNNDSAYATVSALRSVGTEVVAIVDSRPSSAGKFALAHVKDEPIMQGYVVAKVNGYDRVKSVEVVRLVDGETVLGSEKFQCDALCVSGGWNPTLHLYSQAQGKLQYDQDYAAFHRQGSMSGIHVAGCADGAISTLQCIQQGSAAGVDAAAAAGTNVNQEFAPPTASDWVESPMIPLWKVPTHGNKRTKRFVDIQNDVTVDDVELASREGYLSVEHLKRYTTLGMGTDQGRTSNVIGLVELAQLRNETVQQVGHTTFRPPYSPVALGAIASGEHGVHMSPVRRTAIHDWHVENGGDMQNSGAWHRPAIYPRPGEQIRDTIIRETLHVRSKVAIADVSTLGKIAVQGRDAAEFLERVYINRWKSLPIGRVRYGLMLREDGYVFDDGTTTRIGENEYYMTTTTANAAGVMSHLEFYAQTVWPELHVHLTSITDQWSALALAGPYSRDVLNEVLESASASDESLPYMGFVEGTIDEVPARVFRVSFSGELGYEIHMPSRSAVDIWKTVLKAGKPWDISTYGLEALTVLRIEKGHVVAAELDGRTTAKDLGFERMMRKDLDFIGGRLAQRIGMVEGGRKQLVGLVSKNGRPIPHGAQIVASADNKPPAETMGHVTSACYSPHLEKDIALGLVVDGTQLYGSVVHAASPLTGMSVPVEIVHNVFFDPTGERTRN